MRRSVMRTIGGVADIDWVEIGDGVLVRRYAFYDQNIGLVLGDGEALVIDTRSTPRQAEEIRTDVRRVTPFPVTTVVNTHGHGDHAFGNHAFRPATIWGQVGCPPFMARTAEPTRHSMIAAFPEMAADLEAVVVDPPDSVFETAHTIEVGGRTLHLHYLGRGHTDHDIVIEVPDGRILFVGDLMEGGAVPFYGDGYPLDWPGTCEAVTALVEGIVVPGHGDHADIEFAREQTEAVTGIAALARRIDAGELTLDEAMRSTPYPAYRPEDVREPLERAVAQVRGEVA